MLKYKQWNSNGAIKIRDNLVDILLKAGRVTHRDGTPTKAMSVESALNFFKHPANEKQAIEYILYYLDKGGVNMQQAVKDLGWSFPRIRSRILTICNANGSARVSLKRGVYAMAHKGEGKLNIQWSAPTEENEVMSKATTKAVQEKEVSLTTKATRKSNGQTIEVVAFKNKVQRALVKSVLWILRVKVTSQIKELQQCLPLSAT